MSISEGIPHTRARARAVRAPGARALVWGLESGGWTQREAGNLVALLHGIRPARSGWSVREIEHLRFLRALVDEGRIAS
jgi:hypothetical protein